MKKSINFILFSVIGCLFGILLSHIYYTRITTNTVDNKIRYIVDMELNDTSFYTGKNVSEYRFSPMKQVNGIIPDAETAAQIAFDYVSKVYGNNYAVKEQPYHVQLLNNQIWSVNGNLPRNMDGGVFHITMEKYTGKVWSIYHDK